MKNCRECNSQVLPATAVSTNDLCMPCFKRLNAGRTPENLAYITKNDLLELEECWQTFQEIPFPDNMRGKSILGICLVSLDSTVSGCISSALLPNEGSKILEAENIESLKSSLKSLEIIISDLEGESKLYFKYLKLLITKVLEKLTKYPTDHQNRRL